MSYNNILSIVLLLCCVNTAFAWTDEVGVASNETLNINPNPAMNQSSVDAPLDFSDEDIMGEPFTQSSFISNHATTINFAYIIYRYVWDGTNYVKKENCNVTIETSVDLSWDSSINAYVLPPNFNEQMSNGFLVKRYFQELINSDSQYCNQYNNSDDVDKPDVFYSGVTVDAGDGTEQLSTMYVDLDAHDENVMRDEESGYGISLDGRGGEGGSGSIYEGLNIGDAGGEAGTEMKFTFDALFALLIPVIFLVCAMKLIGKII